MSDRALAGCTVVVTRDEPQGGPLTSALERAGATVVAWPAIRVAPPADPAPLERALAELETYDWLVLTSSNAVAAVAERRASLPGTLRVAAVGRSTAESAEARGWRVDRVPAEARGEALLEAFRASGEAAGRRILLPLSDRAPGLLPDGLSALGAAVERVEAYRTLAAAPPNGDGARELAGGPRTALTFASPSAVDGLLEALGPAGFAQLSAGCAVVAIGPTTAARLAAAGAPVDALAEPSSIDGLVAAVPRALAAATRRPNP